MTDRDKSARGAPERRVHLAYTWSHKEADLLGLLFSSISGAPGGTRTPDTRFRRRRQILHQHIRDCMSLMTAGAVSAHCTHTVTVCAAQLYTSESVLAPQTIHAASTGAPPLGMCLVKQGRPHAHRVCTALDFRGRTRR